VSDRDERDAAGNLMPWALACDALSDNGCDCGEDEPGTCLACVCERAMRAERARAEWAEARADAERTTIESIEQEAAELGHDVDGDESVADFMRSLVRERDEARALAGRLVDSGAQT